MKKRTLDFAKSTLTNTNWYQLSRYLTPRILRLETIDPLNCPIIYLGGTGKGKGNLRGRFIDLSGIRHTAFYPVFCLLSTGWEIEYGWKPVTHGSSFDEEKELKEKYRNTHSRKFPCLVNR